MRVRVRVRVRVRRVRVRVRVRVRGWLGGGERTGLRHRAAPKSQALEERGGRSPGGKAERVKSDAREVGSVRTLGGVGVNPSARWTRGLSTTVAAREGSCADSNRRKPDGADRPEGATDVDWESRESQRREGKRRGRGRGRGGRAGEGGWAKGLREREERERRGGESCCRGTVCDRLSPCH